MVYFISDAHLGSRALTSMRTRERRLVKFLDSIKHKATAVYMLGDIFDFWFEYGEVVPKGFVRVLGRLAELSDRGVRVVMFTGNHDMWVGEYLARECGIALFTKPQALSLAGKEIFVAHGDNMNVKGAPLLRLMNGMFRSRMLRKVASWLIHPDLFLRFGHWWSGKSRKSHGGVRSAKVLEPLIDFAIDHSKNHKVDYYIFGHMHYASDVKGAQRILFMGDWHTRPNYLRLDNSGEIELITE